MDQTLSPDTNVYTWMSTWYVLIINFYVSIGIFTIIFQCQRYYHPYEHGHIQQSQPLHWRHNERDGVSNYQPPDCLLNSLFKRRSKKRSKLRVIGLCVGNSPVTGEFPTQKASNAENVFIWLRHHAYYIPVTDQTCIGHLSTQCKQR